MIPVQTKIIAGGVCIFGAGGAGGYFVAKKRLEARYAALAQEEIDSVREAFTNQQKLDKEGVFATPQEAAEALAVPIDPDILENVEIIATNGYAQGVFDTGDDDNTTVVVDTPEGEGVTVKIGTVNIFEQRDESEPTEASLWDHADYEGSEEPYEIPVGFFMQNAGDIEQICLTYYEEDNVLVDDRDQPVPDIEGVVGTANLDQFGHLSQDENIVYVRNEKMRADYEVSRHPGSYAVEVLGMTPEEERRPRVNRRGVRED